MTGKGTHRYGTSHIIYTYIFQCVSFSIDQWEVTHLQEMSRDNNNFVTFGEFCPVNNTRPLPPVSNKELKYIDIIYICLIDRQKSFLVKLACFYYSGISFMKAIHITIR